MDVDVVVERSARARREALRFGRVKMEVRSVLLGCFRFAGRVFVLELVLLIVEEWDEVEIKEESAVENVVSAVGTGFVGRGAP